MTTRRLLIVSIHFFMTLDLCQPYHFIDEECMSRYNCTLKVRAHIRECIAYTHRVPPPGRQGLSLLFYFLVARYKEDIYIYFDISPLYATYNGRTEQAVKQIVICRFRRGTRLIKKKSVIHHVTPGVYPGCITFISV